MRIVASILVGLILPFSFAACSGDESNKEPTSQVTVTETPADPDDVFIAVVHDLYPESVLAPDQSIIDLAKSTCDALDVGVSLDDIRDIGFTSGLDPELYGTIVGAGIATYCPEYGDLINGSTI